jgi:hypothetical protein
MRMMNDKEIAMRKTVSVLVLCAAVVWPVMAQSADFEIEDGELVKYRWSAAEVVVPADVTGIGARAFFECESLGSISLPAGLTAIGDGAFAECGSLRSINLPAGLISLGDYAFDGCRSLASISLPAGLTVIGAGAFARCRSLGSIQADSANRSFAARDGVLFNKARTALLAYPAGKAGTSYAVPEGVTAIRDYAFSGCGSLGSISLPAGLTGIGDGAFAWCRNQGSLRRPEGNRGIGDYALVGCGSLVA